MKLTVYLIDESTLTIENFDAESALDMVEELETSRFVQFQMDEASVIVSTDQIVRIDLD